jgi:hypothetical protein
LYDTWALAVDSHFNLTYWPFVQSNLTNTCMQQVMAVSRANIDKSGGVMGVSLGLLKVILGMVMVMMIIS